MTKLSVNINKIATIRNARGGSEPDLIKFANRCYTTGAEGITIHPRPDQRHIRYRDAIELSHLYPKPDCEYNIEGKPNDKFMELVLKTKPTQCTLVPDADNVLTSDSGWNTIRHFDMLKDITYTLQSSGIRVSLFIETDNKMIENAKKLGADRIELYTGPYAYMYAKNREKAIKPYIESAKYCNEIGIGINAGHDLSLDNLNYFWSHIPNLMEVSIGHALISDCLYFGVDNTINMYKRLMK